LLAHSPDAVIEACQYPGIVLQLSGHVHGGHVRLPALGPLAKPRFGLKYTHGTYRVASTDLHVSIGLGGRPFRLGNTPELTIFRCVHRKD
jgi:predicted MPP superfamily phosphohydrolase